MTIELPVPAGVTIYCDDLREEVGGKMSYMGVYRGVMFLHTQLPVHLPRFFIVVMFSYAASEALDPVTIRIYFPGNINDDEPNMVFELPVEPDAPVPSWMSDTLPENMTKSIVLPIGFAPLVIERLGKFRVRVVKGERVYRLAALEVILGENVPSAATENGGAAP